MTANHVSVRLDAGTLARVDALIPRVPSQRRSASRSDVLRALVLRALDLGDGAPPTQRDEADVCAPASGRSAI